MGAIASQITSLAIIYSITQSFIQTHIKENIKAPRHWPLCGEFTGDQWIPHTNGQLRGKCFHLMTSSWSQKLSSHPHLSRLHSYVSKILICSVPLVVRNKWPIWNFHAWIRNKRHWKKMCGSVYCNPSVFWKSCTMFPDLSMVMATKLAQNWNQINRFSYMEDLTNILRYCFTAKPLPNTNSRYSGTCMTPSLYSTLLKEI